MMMMTERKVRTQAAGPGPSGTAKGKTVKSHKTLYYALLDVP